MCFCSRFKAILGATVTDGKMSGLHMQQSVTSLIIQSLHQLFQITAEMTNHKWPNMA